MVSWYISICVLNYLKVNSTVMFPIIPLVNNIECFDVVKPILCLSLLSNAMQWSGGRHLSPVTSPTHPSPLPPLLWQRGAASAPAISAKANSHKKWRRGQWVLKEKSIRQSFSGTPSLLHLLKLPSWQVFLRQTKCFRQTNIWNAEFCFQLQFSALS